MASDRNGGSSDVTSAYQRAIAREENEASSDPQVTDAEILQAGIHAQDRIKSEIDVDGDSDLYRHHSQQQSLEGG